MWWITGGVVYIVGGAITYGCLGGIRDEMEGLLDSFIVTFWPIALALLIIIGCLVWLVGIGNTIRKTITKGMRVK